MVRLKDDGVSTRSVLGVVVLYRLGGRVNSVVGFGGIKMTLALCLSPMLVLALVPFVAYTFFVVHHSSILSGRNPHMHTPRGAATGTTLAERGTRNPGKAHHVARHGARRTKRRGDLSHLLADTPPLRWSTAELWHCRLRTRHADLVWLI